MKYVLSILLILITLLISVSHALESEREKVTVLFTSDTYGKIKPYG